MDSDRTIFRNENAIVVLPHFSLIPSIRHSPRTEQNKTNEIFRVHDTKMTETKCSEKLRSLDFDSSAINNHDLGHSCFKFLFIIKI